CARVQNAVRDRIGVREGGRCNDAPEATHCAVRIEGTAGWERTATTLIQHPEEVLAGTAHRVLFTTLKAHSDRGIHGTVGCGPEHHGSIVEQDIVPGSENGFRHGTQCYVDCGPAGWIWNGGTDSDLDVTQRCRRR